MGLFACHAEEIKILLASLTITIESKINPGRSFQTLKLETHLAPLNRNEE